MELLTQQAHDKNLELRWYIQPEVPDALVGDPTRLRQIIINLVNNGIKFTEKGEVVVNVEADSIEQDEAWLHFSVKDTGVGIQSAVQEEIFDAFAQADGSTTRKFGGTGLGLAICSSLVDMMGGRIWIESEVGRGSTFHFTARLGIRQGQHNEPMQVKPMDKRDIPVLVVDDVATNRKILEKMLSSWNMRPIAVDSGHSALSEVERAKSKGEPFPLALIDVHMPEMDGFELAEHLNQGSEQPETKIVMLTSRDWSGDVAKFRELGLAAYLTKPIRPSSLLETITAVLDATVSEDDQSALLLGGRSFEESERSLHILVAEDHPVNQELVRSLLVKRGHTTTVVNNGREVLAALKKESYDLVLMDVQMPEMDGLDATIAIRENEKGMGTYIPIIAMTANAMQGDRERCLEAGMDDYISKPVRVQELFNVVNDVASVATDVNTDGSEERRADDATDEAALLANFSGDRKLAMKIGNMLLESLPRHMSEIRDAVAARDGETLWHTAHGFKGAVGMFSAGACESARTLELMGHSGNLDDADEAYAALEGEVAHLKSVITALLNGNEPLDAKRNEPPDSGDEKSTIKILIVDDHPIMRSGIRGILADCQNILVAGEAGSATEALNKIRAESWDVVVLDIGMPGRSGLDVLKDIKHERPTLPILILSTYSEEQFAVRALKAGASGYLTKDRAPDVLVNAINTVHLGGRYVSERLAEKLAFELQSSSPGALHETLSDREYEVMRFIASGKTVSEIASELSLSVKTVSTYKTRVFKKLGMKNNTDLMRYAFANNLVNLESFS